MSKFLVLLSQNLQINQLTNLKMALKISVIQNSRERI
jgi:hypothetical protein